VVLVSSTPALAAQLQMPSVSNSPRLAVDEVFIVGNTGGSGANLRAEPSLTASVLDVLPEGTTVVASGPAERHEGREWRRVETLGLYGGTPGWIATEFLLASSPRSVTARTPSSVTALAPPSCTDAWLGFPRSDNPRIAVRLALPAGIQLTNNPYLDRYLDQSELIVASWIAVSLQRERRGYPGISLARWIGDGSTLSYRLSEDQWLDMLSWDPRSCEGAFLAEPANMRIITLLRGIVSPGQASDTPIPLESSGPLEAMTCASPEQTSLRNLQYTVETGQYRFVVYEGHSETSALTPCGCQDASGQS
jgi:hypothetical protein